jgi:hypothetical protein
VSGEESVGQQEVELCQKQKKKGRALHIAAGSTEYCNNQTPCRLGQVQDAGDPFSVDRDIAKDNNKRKLSLVCAKKKKTKNEWSM